MNPTVTYEVEVNEPRQSRGWLERLVSWRRQRVAAGIRMEIARLEAQEPVWKACFTAPETNSYFIERYAELVGKIAAAKERLRQLLAS